MKVELKQVFMGPVSRGRGHGKAQGTAECWNFLKKSKSRWCKDESVKASRAIHRGAVLWEGSWGKQAVAGTLGKRSQAHQEQKEGSQPQPKMLTTRARELASVERRGVPCSPTYIAILLSCRPCTNLLSAQPSLSTSVSKKRWPSL